MVSRIIPAAAVPFFPSMTNLPSGGNVEYSSRHMGSRGVNCTFPTLSPDKTEGCWEVVVSWVGSISVSIRCTWHLFWAVPYLMVSCFPLVIFMLDSRIIWAVNSSILGGWLSGWLRTSPRGTVLIPCMRRPMESPGSACVVSLPEVSIFVSRPVFPEGLKMTGSPCFNVPVSILQAMIL